MGSTQRALWFIIFLATGFIPSCYRPVNGSGFPAGEWTMKEVSGYDNGEGAAESPLLEKFRILLRFTKGSVPYPPSSSPAPAPAPAPAPTLAPVWALRRPFSGLSTSPLPRPSRVPPLRPEELRHVTSPEAGLIRIVVAVLVSVTAVLAIAAFSVLLLCYRRHARTEKRALPKRANLCNSMDKVSFDPTTQVFFLDEHEPPGSPPVAAGTKMLEPPAEIDNRVKHSPPHAAGGEEDSGSESFHSISPTSLPSLSDPPASSTRPNPPPPPPPPPRPPPLRTRKEAPPPPLPPPSSAAVGKDGSPLPKLKPLHWDKVRAASDRSMVWDKIRSSSFELDEETIGSLFSYNLQSSGRSEEGAAKATCSPEKRLFEHKRLQNLTILLKAVNATSDQVRSTLAKGSGLNAQQMEALANMAPTEEEQEKLLGFEGNPDGELDPAEKFLREVLSVPFSFSRIQSMLYRESFADESRHLRDCYLTLEEACRELRSSRLFMRLLEAVLKTGNRMNVGTIRGGAMAFKLNALLKLADVKGTDGKTTLLHFVVQEIVRAEGGSGSSPAPEKDLVSGLSAELHNVKKTACMDLTALAQSAANLAAGLRELQELLRQCQSADAIGEGFVEVMGSFSDEAEKVLKELKEEESRAMRMVKSITEYFHGNVDNEEKNPLGIFMIVRDFLDMLDRVCKELRAFGSTLYSPSRAAPLSSR